ncbi:DUF222 domain-containing protein [Pseudonocardia broussonetiae]|uniref:DUF222 domain-containing protein n=1 Tax=Pseudonocardia broussonetiae TaxID=2736640 RepID=A0A6M6JPX8_9PSEU|nr:DUF222 domain-containing protein [Pseudonocardia broussonetiae]QJY49316.1 DUF222 domain-containing protein [Pseudonocardia broussonetiae]
MAPGPLLADALDEPASVVATGSETELLSLLALCEGVTRRVDAISTSAIATLDDQGAFLTRGYRSAARALSDLLSWDYVEARRRAAVAVDVHARTTLDGTPLPARLPSAAAAFAAGEIALRHVEVIGRILSTDAAGRLSPEQWAGVEAQPASDAARLNPSELQTLGTALVALLDQDGAEPDDHTPAPVNELRLTRHASGGSIKGRFEDPALYDAIAAVIDAKSAPLTADDDRPAPQRQAEALADICGYVLDHGDLPDTGGRRPLLTVIVRLEDLENRARSAMLEFGGSLTPAALRTLACDAGVIPVVMNGAGQPSTSAAPPAPSPTACAARSPPGTAAAPTPAATDPLLVGGPPHPPLGTRRTHRPAQPGDAVQGPPPPDPPHRLAGPHPGRPARVPAPEVDRPAPDTAPQSPRPPRSGLNPAQDHQEWCQAVIGDRLTPLLTIMTPARPEPRPTPPYPTPPCPTPPCPAPPGARPAPPPCPALP